MVEYQFGHNSLLSLVWQDAYAAGRHDAVLVGCGWGFLVGVLGALFTFFVLWMV